MQIEKYMNFTAIKVLNKEINEAETNIHSYTIAQIRGNKTWS